MNEKEKLLLRYFEQFLSEKRKSIVDRVLGQRTRHVTVVLEDIFQSQNASAVVRTCECMGLQDIHIIEQRTKYEINPRVLRGANKWIDMFRYHEKGVNNVEACYNRLRKTGYKILVADPSPEGVSIHEIDVRNNKIAMVFGNELYGISDFALAQADEKIKIPMYGFTESLNVSVSVAICLNTVVQKIQQADLDVCLSSEEKDEVKLRWYRKIVRGADLIEQDFFRTN